MEIILSKFRKTKFRKMKRLIFLAIAFVFTISAANAQMILKRGDMVAQVGLGLPDSEGLDVKLPAIIGAFDYGFTDKLGIGYISGGGLVSIATFGSDNVLGGETKATSIHIMARSAYHFDFVDITGNKVFDDFDIYAGLGLGFEYVKGKYTVGNGDTTSGSDTDPVADIFIGSRYAINPQLGVFVEIGAEVAFISGGVCFRF